MTVLKIDQGARREDRRAELARILRDAVWGEDSRRHLTLRRLLGALVAYHSDKDSMDPLNDALTSIVESAASGLIVKAGSWWKPAEQIWEAK